MGKAPSKKKGVEAGCVRRVPGISKRLWSKAMERKKKKRKYQTHSHSKIRKKKVGRGENTTLKIDHNPRVDYVQGQQPPEKVFPKVGNAGDIQKKRQEENYDAFDKIERGKVTKQNVGGNAPGEIKRKRDTLCK